MPIDIYQIVKLEVVFPKLVRCEFCQAEYVYEMQCKHVASASVIKHGSKAEAEAIAWAEKLAIDQIRDGCEAVPCPKCYQYQRQMSEFLGSKRYAWLMFFVVPLLLAGGLSLPVALFEVNTQARLAALGVIAGSVVGFLVLWAISDRLIKGHDGNRQPEHRRMAIADERAFLPEAFNKLHGERVQVAYQSYLRKAAKKKNPKPFVVDVWIKEESLANGQPIAVALPTGDVSTLDVDESLETGSVYQLHSQSGQEIPFLARVCVFNRTPLAL